MSESKKKKAKKRKSPKGLPIYGGKEGIWEEAKKKIKQEGKEVNYKNLMKQYKREIEKHPELKKARLKPKQSKSISKEEKEVLEEQAQIRRNIEKEVKAKIKASPEADIEQSIADIAHTQRKGMNRVIARKTLLSDEEFKKELQKIKEKSKKEKEEN